MKNKKLEYNTINDLIIILQTIKTAYGDLPIINSYDGESWIGGTLEVNENARDPDDYSGPRIQAVEF